MESPTLLLVHGSWHGPWCWDLLLPELHVLGLRTATVALPSMGTRREDLGSLHDDAAAIERAAASLPGDVVVVAHSYGGVPTTQARFGPNVRHLVFLGAFLPDVGQALVHLLPPGPLPPFVVAHEDGTTSVHPDHAVAAFYAHCPPEVAAWAASRLTLHHTGAITTPVDRCSWHHTPSSYVLLSDDHACPTVSQRQMVKRATHAHELPGDHSPFFRRPGELARLLASIVLDAGMGRASRA